MTFSVLFPFKETHWAACPDKTTSTDEQRKNTVVVKTQAQKAKCLDFICSSATNFLDDCSQVNQVHFFQTASMPFLHMHEAHVHHSGHSDIQIQKQARASQELCYSRSKPTSSVGPSLAADGSGCPGRKAKAEWTELDASMLRLSSLQPHQGVGLPEQWVVCMKLATLKGFVNLGAWVVQDKLSGHLGNFSFLGAGLSSSTSDPLGHTGLLLLVQRRAFPSLCQLPASHKEVMLPARELRLNTLVFPHALEGKSGENYCCDV